MTTVLGSIHAFSVFVPEWEQLRGADRSSVSFVYSLALITLTVMVLLGHHLYRRLPAAILFLIAGIGASGGLALAARSDSLPELYLSYGLVFGAANGLGYGYALQLSGQALPARKGLAMGLVTAFYAVGATVFPILFTYLINSSGNSLALSVMSLIVLAVSCLAACIVFWTKAVCDVERTSTYNRLSANLKQVRLLFWIAYGAGAAAGLMVIGHAYGIAIWFGLDSRGATISVIVLSLGNMLGGFAAGYSADRYTARHILAGLPIVSGFAIITMYILGFRFDISVWTGIALIGFCYGALIAVYPVAISDVYGSKASARVYGQIFTAWGLAGLIGPWSSGWFFDLTNSYVPALVLAVVLCVLSATVARRFPARAATN